MVELADTRDLKSLDGDIVPVRPRLAAPGCAWTQSASKAQPFLLSYRSRLWRAAVRRRFRVERLGAQVAFGAFVLLRLFPRACGGFRFASASRTEPGRSPRPRFSFFFCRIARAGGAQLFVGGSSREPRRAGRVRGFLFSAALPAPLLPAAAGAGERGENRGGAS